MALESIALLTLQALEESMWVSESRFDPTYMDAVLHPDFTEVGRSGRLFTRDDVLSMPPVEIRIEIPLRGLEIVEIAPDVVLTRYTTVPLDSPHGAAHRTSIWLHEDERWLLRFHQGTPTSDTSDD